LQSFQDKASCQDLFTSWMRNVLFCMVRANAV